ncbi:MAG: hypothetical protein E6H03_10920, partial [Bacillati bacterium ANGP1]
MAECRAALPGRAMRSSSRTPRRVSVFATIGALLAMILAIPVSSPGWAAGPAALVWGRSGDVFTLDVPLSPDTQTTMVSTQIY